MVALYRLEDELIRAGQENKRRGRDSRQGNFSNLLRGRWPFGQVPFGWKYDREQYRFIADTEQQKNLRWIYEQAATGMGTPKIAQALRQQKTLLPKAVESEKRLKKLADRQPDGQFRWEQSAVRRLLARDYHHTGVMRFSVGEQYGDLLSAYRQGHEKPAAEKLTADGFIEFAVAGMDGQPAIPAALWRQARQYIDHRAKRHGGQRRGDGNVFLFGPWLKCECGGSIRARTHRRKNPLAGDVEYRYYTCRFHAADTDRDGQTPCTAPHLHADEVDARLWAMLLDWICEPSALLDKYFAQADRPVDPADLERRIADARAEQAKHERQRDKLLDLFTEDSIDKSSLTRRSREEAEAIDRLGSEIVLLRAALADAKLMAERITKDQMLIEQFEKSVAAVRAELRVALDGLDWHQRRTLLKHVLGLDEIKLGWRPVASIRSIAKQRAGHGETGQQAADRFIKRWMVQPPATGETNGLFIVGVILPVHPAEIIDGLRSVGLDRILASRGLALASPSG